MVRKKIKDLDQTKIVRKKSRDTFKDYDLHTRVCESKKSYKRKQKHKRDLRD